MNTYPRQLNDRELELLNRRNNRKRRKKSPQWNPGTETVITYDTPSPYITVCYIYSRGELKTGIAVRNKNDAPNETAGAEIAFMKALRAQPVHLW